MKNLWIGHSYPSLNIYLGLVPKYNRHLWKWIPRYYYDVSDADIEMFGLRSKWLWVTYYRVWKA